MKIAFFSNFLNHHQLPFCKAILSSENVEFKFIATERITEERLSLGYEDMTGKNDFVIHTFENIEGTKKAQEIADTYDVVIVGSAPMNFVKKRLRDKKLTFRYTERLYKKQCPWYELLPRTIKNFIVNGRHESLYLLCASAYTSADYAKTCTFLNKAYKWGYFPEVKKYDNINHLIENKKKNSILWVARLIDWKHPELSIEVAKKLKADGINFKLNIIGNGVMGKELAELINAYGLENEVEMLGSMPPEKVREYMEESEIFMFTSDRNEGWGAVLNESMNSGCAVVANHMIGSVPFLIDDNKNGMIYRDGDIDDLYKKVKFLVDNPDKRAKMGEKAYETLVHEWNAENAATKFIELSQAILDGNKKPDLFDDDVCSKAEILNDGWFL